VVDVGEEEQQAGLQVVQQVLLHRLAVDTLIKRGDE